MSRRQEEALEELEQWREDVCEDGIGSRVVLLAVPTGWGRSEVLTRFGDMAEDADGPVTLVARLDGNVPGDRAAQATGLRKVLTEFSPPSRAAELLDLDTPAGKAGLGLDVAGWFVPGLAAAVSVTMLSRLLGAAGRGLDDGPAGEAARAARRVAAISVKVPVMVVIDDADQLDAGLARAVITGLAGRYDGQVLVVAAASPDSDLVTGLVKDAGYDLAGRIRKVSVDPGMDYAARVELARERLPDLPAQAAEQIARRTVTFGEVFGVAAEDMMAELGPGTSAGDAVTAADTAIDAALDRAVPSEEAAVLAWAGGALHERQVDACLRVLGADRVERDVHVRRAGSLVCLADPASPRCAEQADAISDRRRTRLAGAVLAAVGQVAADPDAGLAERVVARQAVHRVRVQLDPALRNQLPQLQCALIRGLEKLADYEAAWQVAWEAQAETPKGNPGRQALLMAYLRLARIRPPAGREDPLAEEAIGVALAAGAAIGLEARVWAAADLLARDGHREQALALAGRVASELDTHVGLGDAGDQWRLLLAFAAGRAGRLAITQRLLAPMLSSHTVSREKAAQAILRAVDGPHADIRLQIILLQAELEAAPAAAGDQLRIHAALADAYDNLGIYPQALRHGRHELALRRRLQRPNHPYTLATRGNIVFWTGECGDAVEALRLATALLSDQERVLGPDHPDTLTNRSNIASLTGDCGDPAGALRLATALLPDQERVLGPDHPRTLTSRNNIAFLTENGGDAAGALRLLIALLPDMERVLGPGHSDTLMIRGNIASLTGDCGDPAGALRLVTALLPDQERVLGPDHPRTLTTRNNVAVWTGESGDPAGALRLATALLPDRERVLGPDHSDTLITRNNVASLTGDCGDAAGALRLFTEQLPDRERLLGSDHPDTLITRGNIAALTGKCGDAAGALRLFIELLPDRERVLGSDHPDTLRTRGNIAAWTARIRHKSRDESDQSLLAELGRLADEAVAAGDTAGVVSYCEQMVATAEEAFGPSDIRLTGYLRRAASTLAAADRDAQAMEMLTRAVTIHDRYGAENAETIDDLCNLAELQERNGLHQEARQNLDCARDIKVRIGRVAG